MLLYELSIKGIILNMNKHELFNSTEEHSHESPQPTGISLSRTFIEKSAAAILADWQRMSDVFHISGMSLSAILGNQAFETIESLRELIKTYLVAHIKADNQDTIVDLILMHCYQAGLPHAANYDFEAMLQLAQQLSQQNTEDVDTAALQPIELGILTLYLLKMELKSLKEFSIRELRLLKIVLGIPITLIM